MNTLLCTPVCLLLVPPVQYTLVKDVYKQTIELKKVYEWEEKESSTSRVVASSWAHCKGPYLQTSITFVKCVWVCVRQELERGVVPCISAGRFCIIYLLGLKHLQTIWAWVWHHALLCARSGYSFVFRLETLRCLWNHKLSNATQQRETSCA